MKICKSQALAVAATILLHLFGSPNLLAGQTPADTTNREAKPDLLISVNVQFLEIEPDPKASKPASPGASTNVIGPCFAWEGDFNEFLKARGQRLGADVMPASNCVTGSRHGFRVTVTDDRHVTIAPSGSEFSPPTKSFALHPEFDVYLKGLNPDRTAIEVEVVENNVDFVGQKNTAKSVRQAASDIFFQPGETFEQVSTVSVNEVADGQSAMIGFLPDRVEIRATRKVPLLGRLPLAGRWFTRQTTEAGWRDVAAVFTFTMVHQDGTPYHTQAERDALPSRQPNVERVVPHQATTVGSRGTSERPG